MVERVERLREAERVLGDERELERPNRGVDDLVEARGLEHEPPELVAFLAGVAARRASAPASASTMARSDMPSRSASFARMLSPRTTAYCRYGPVSPSKLRASSMSNAMTLPRVNLTRKYRTAAIAIASRRSPASAGGKLRIALGDFPCGRLDRADRAGRRP